MAVTMTTAKTIKTSGNKHLKLRRHTSAANPQDLQDVECGKANASGGGYDHDDVQDKKDVGFVLARRPAEFLSGLSPLSRRIVRFVTPGYQPTPYRCTSERLISVAAQTIPAMAALLALPFLVWDDYPEEWGIFNIYPFVRHVEIVWSSLLHMAAWPIVAVTLLAAAALPRGGVGSPKYLPRKRAGAATQTERLAALASATMANMTCSTWKTSLLLSFVFCSAVLVNMTFQMGYPHALWNPFMWGWYRVYYPSNISRALKGACLNFEKHSASRQPLCLLEHEWDELSSGQLSSYNPNDVLTVQKGLDYLQNQSGGLIINALARNVADSIPALKQNMEGLAPFFKDPENKLSLVVFENDSNDGTRQAFQSWSDQEAGRKEPRYTVDLMSCGPKNPDCKLGIIDRYDMNLYMNPTASGVGKLGEFRQILLEYILGKEEYKDYSHMVILDVDLGTSISPLGLLHTLGLEDSVAHHHVVASTSSQIWPGTMGSIIPPYDLSAFRPKKSASNQKVRRMHQKFCEMVPAGDRWRNMCEASSPMQLFMIRSANDVTNHHEQPYEVVSAFNGLAIYPISLIRERGKDARYNAGDDGQRCEHVGFHISLSRPMYVNPKWSMNLKASKPGGPTGLCGIKTLIYAILGRPDVMMCVVAWNLVFLFLFVYLFFVIGSATKSLFLLLNLPQEKRDHVDASGIEAREK